MTAMINCVDFRKEEVLALKAGTKKRHIIPAFLPTIIWNGCVPLGAGQYLLIPNKDNFCVQCQHGGPGDRVWIREKWCHGADKQGRTVVYYEADGECRAAYCSESGDGDFSHAGEISPSPWEYEKRWNLASDMPRGASRFALEVTKVRLRLMGDISNDEAELYGIEKLTEGWWLDYTSKYNGTAQGVVSPLSSLRGMWDTSSPNRLWNDRDWVWDIDFERVTERFDAHRDLNLD